MKVHCNYDNKDGNCWYPECWSGCANKVMELNLLQYIKYKYYQWKAKRHEKAKNKKPKMLPYFHTCHKCKKETGLYVIREWYFGLLKRVICIDCINKKRK